MKRTKGIRLLAVLMAALMMVAMAPALGMSEVNAADERNDTYDQYMMTKELDQYSDPDYEPYGFGKDVPFFLNKQSELLFYQTNSESSGDIGTFFDKLNKASTDNVLSGSKTSALKAPPAKLKKAYFVQAESFDPTGTGRDDHIAFIGVYQDGSSTRCYVWVYDTVNRRWTSEFEFGPKCNWMKSESVTDYEAANFISITAGDYDGNGKDTIVAFCSCDGTDCVSIFELECQYPGFKIGYYKGKTSSEGWALRKDSYSNALAEMNTKKTKMACELGTGDINGDGLDDLVSLTYIGNYEDKSLKLETYRPLVSISYGSKSKNSMTNTLDHRCGTWRWKEGWYWRSQVSPGMSIGDIDKDGKDEIVTAGTLILQKKKDEDTSERIRDFYNGKLLVSIINDTDDLEYYTETAMNPWTESGFYPGDDIWSKTAVECVAVNGPGNPEQVFIAGTLYKYDGGKLSAVHTPDYFAYDGDNKDNLTSKSSTNMFIQSTAAGNFDGNSQGYEQVAFTVSCKTSGKMNYDYLRGVVGGKNYNNVTGIARNYYSTARDKMNDSYSWPGSGKDNRSGSVDEQKGLNCIVVAADCDNDGVLARYKDKCMIYADPEVMCVLQAPPYFKEVKDYLTDSSSTSYEVTNTYQFESSKSESVSYGVGVVAGMESPAIQMEVTAGYALDWTTEFTSGLSDSIKVGWNAKEKDVVVLMRKPVISYNYQIQSKDGNWKDECIVITVPCEPDYKSLSIEEYNEFAAYYNKTMAKYSSDFHKLGILNNKWLGHEGDPKSYIKSNNSLFKTDSAYRLIQKNALSLGHNSDSVTWGKITGYSSGITEQMSHGFTYDATIAMGPNAGAASVYVGLSTSLQYMSGNSTSETQTTETGVSCEINSLKYDTPKELKPGEYNFSFRMARWPSGLKRYVNGKAEDVPVYGYALSGVTVPTNDESISVEDQLKASAVIDMMTEIPAIENITLADEPAIIKIREAYEALSDAAKTLVNVKEIEAMESRIELLKNGGMDITGAEVKLSKSAFTFNGRVQKPEVLSVNGYVLKEGVDYIADWSNASSKNAGTYSLTLNGSGLCTGSVTVSYKINRAANPLSVAGKTVAVKYKAVKKKNQTLTAAKAIKFTRQGQGKLTYKLVSVTGKKYKKFFKIDTKTGKITIKKKLKKGTYKLKVQVRAAGNANYGPSAVKTVTIKVKVK
ncbi:MAG: hypothetical protein IJH43_04615 [Mogibacterium sp.]|nr:hypothetical protein [Mogibacterium sp.]